MDVMRWWLDSLLNLAPFLLLAAAALAAGTAFERQWTAAAPLGVLAILLAAWHAQSGSLLARGTECGAGPSLVLATANVGGRLDAGAVVDRLSRVPDILVLQEASGRGLTDQASPDAYPYQYVSDPAWLHVLVRNEVLEWSPTPTPHYDDGRSVVRFETRIGDSTLTVVALHALAPVRVANYRGRTQQYAAIEEIAANTEGPLVVLGDLNATLHSPALNSLLRRTGLRSAVAGRREAPTWPAGFGPFGLRLDHVLVRGLTVCDVEVGPAVSDHRPVVVEVSLGNVP